MQIFSTNQIFLNLALTTFLTMIFTLNRASFAADVTLGGPTGILKQTSPSEAQGLTGLVIRVVGPIYSPIHAHHTKREFISTRIWIFSGKIKRLTDSSRLPISQALNHPNLMGWVVSDSLGQFQVGLKPGEYTIFSEYGSDLYQEIFQASGDYLSIKIEENQIQRINLFNREKAVMR
jgi:hypothetical protein